MTFPRFQFSKNRKSKTPPATAATSATFKRTEREHPSNVATVAEVAGGVPENENFEDLFFEFEEHAAIIAEGCGMSQVDATELAAREFGFSCSGEFYETIAGRRAANKGETTCGEIEAARRPPFAHKHAEKIG